MVTHPKTYETVPLREDILTTLRKMAPHASALGSTEALAHLEQVVADVSDATHLRQQFELQGSCEGMVNAAIQRFRGAGKH
jgi:carboxylate-amine ligase